jgi:hypothetical protein
MELAENEFFIVQFSIHENVSMNSLSAKTLFDHFNFHYWNRWDFDKAWRNNDVFSFRHQ